MPSSEQQNANENQDAAATEKSSLLEAFARFQNHCEKLESAHVELRKRLEHAELRLEQKNRELAVRLREIDDIKRRLSAVIESIPDPLLVIDQNQSVELANSAAQNLFPLLEATESIAGTIPELDHLLENEQEIRDVETVLDHPDGDITLVATATPLANPEGQGQNRVLALKNVTEYRRLKERLARESRLAALGEVAANVAHEIRNPLGAIEGFGRLLQKDLEKANPDAVRLLTRMVFAANQMNCVVSNLLNFTRHTTPHFMPADMTTIIEEVIGMMELKAEENDVNLQLKAQPGQGQCMLDPVRVKEVVINLVANAIQACPPRSDAQVIMTVKQQNAHVEFTISDNGPGIPETDLNRIFEPFYTLKNDGIGLGLALCKRIVEEHEGVIHAQNNPDGGACFILRIPVQQSIPTSAGKQPQLPQRQTSEPQA